MLLITFLVSSLATGRKSFGSGSSGALSLTSKSINVKEVVFWLVPGIETNLNLLISMLFKIQILTSISLIIILDINMDFMLGDTIVPIQNRVTLEFDLNKTAGDVDLKKFTKIRKLWIVNHILEGIMRS